MTRRTCLAMGLAAAAGEKRYRVAIIGDTGHGNFGHNWDLGWNRIPAAEVVAVSDPDPKGRASAQARSGAPRAYGQWREMLSREKPDIVNIAVRWADRHAEMVEAAADMGAHLIVEKPFSQNLPEADRMVETIERRRVKAQVGHAARTSTNGLMVRRMLAEGMLGDIVEIRARGKEDARAGGEDLIVLGSHALDLMRFFAGDPRWVFAHATQGGRDATLADVREGREKVGHFLGDQVAAMFAFDNGVHGYFGSKAAAPYPPGNRCGVTVLGSKGAIFVNLGTSRSAEAWIIRSAAWMDGKDVRWEPLPLTAPEIEGNLDRASQAMALDLLEAIRTGREPACNQRDGRWTIEMIAGIWRSHLSGARVSFPLEDRGDPLARR